MERRVEGLPLVLDSEDDDMSPCTLLVDVRLGGEGRVALGWDMDALGVEERDSYPES
jgi:metal-dependent amidase/aminoacylase/carboxypeptidase family protein